MTRMNLFSAGLAGALWWIGVISWIGYKRKRKQRHATHRALHLSGRAQLGSEIDPGAYSDAMLRAAKTCLGYLAALLLTVLALWLASTLVAK